jgi:hypothetical protein
MPNWKKVIVSGSSAVLTSVTATIGLTVTGSARITGSLGVTGSLSNGLGIIASGNYSHAEGESTIASGNYSHAEGTSTIASGDYSHAEGYGTTATGIASHAEGLFTIAPGDYSHAEGSSTIASGSFSHAEGESTETIGQYSHAEGVFTIASGASSHAEGSSTTATGDYSHAEGDSTTSTGAYSHAEGLNTTSTGAYSHAEGRDTLASGSYSHAEGLNTTSTGVYSHAEGKGTIATGASSHAEGDSTVASGSYSHAEGSSTTSIGDYSHAEGFFTVASGSYQHVQGQYNISSSAQSAFIVGNGTSGAARSNLIFASGSQVQITGSLIVSGSSTFTNIGPAIFSGSVTSTAGFTGSLQGDANLHTLNVDIIYFPNTTYTVAGEGNNIILNYDDDETNTQINHFSGDATTQFLETSLTTSVPVIAPSFSASGGFTGSLQGTAVSASGNIFGYTFYADLGLNAGYHIGSGKPALSITPGGTLNLGAAHPSHIAAGVSIFTTGSDSSKGLFLDSTGNITASGNISASGAGTFGGDVTLGPAGNGYRFLASTDTDQSAPTFTDISSVNAGMTIINDAVYLINDGNAKLTLSGSRFGIGIQTPGESLEVKSAFGQSGNILASGHISASSLISETHITASGNISASGTITAENIAVAADLTVTGNIIGASRKYELPSSTVGDFKGGDIYYYGDGSTVKGGIYYINGTNWTLADADAEASTAGLLAVALGTDPDVDGMLLRGFVTLLTEVEGTEAIGSVLYLSATDSGKATVTVPGSGNFVRVLGYSLHATENQVYFNPGSTWVEVA